MATAISRSRRRREFRSALVDFSGGTIGGISDYGRRVRHVRFSDNCFMRPAGAMRVRGGSRRISSAVLAHQPHSLGEILSASGSSKVFAAAKPGASTGALYEVTDSAFIAQTTPGSLTNRLFSFEQLDDSLWAAQMGGAMAPIFFRANNPANAWHSMVLPKPGSAPTFGADQVGGSLTPGAPGPAGDYFYRVRWRYQHGSSLAGPVSAAQQVVPASGNYKIRLATLPVPGASRTDYLGWTLERTKIGGTAAGPFYLVTDGTLTTHDDGVADADMFDRTDELLHFGPQSYEGLVAHKNRLFGWIGSMLYASQEIGDDEATGLCNWPALQGYPFGKDDGDAIQSVVRHQDRLVVVKRQSVWALEGDDPDSFRVVPIVSGVGAAGPRAVTSHGGRVWIFGSNGAVGPATGMSILTGNTVKPFGWVEVGHYVDDLSAALAGDIELIQYLGNYVLGAYSKGAGHNEEQIVYDQRFDNWTHFTNWRIRGSLVQRGSLFGGATLIFCDPRNWPAFTKAGVVVGMTVTGAGIPGATTVASIATDGASFVLSAPATATAGPVSLTFGGSIVIATCYTTNTSTTVESKDYRIWQGFSGFKDDKAADGTGGDPIPWSVQTPWMDDGAPDVFKDYSRVQLFAEADGETVGISIEFDPSAPTATLSALIKNSGALWGAFTWGASDWAKPTEASFASGIPEGSIARRWRARISANVSSDLVFSGIVVDGTIEAERRFSNAGVPA
jgi:hypothetical protein